MRALLQHIARELGDLVLHSKNLSWDERLLSPPFGLTPEMSVKDPSALPGGGRE